MNLKYTKLVIERSRFAAGQYDINLANEAEREVAAMQAWIDTLEAVRKAAQSHMDFHGKPKGISKTNDDLLDALAECDE